MSSSAQSSNTSPCEFAKIALSKALLSFLTACCHKNDAEGSSTGATFCEVQSQKFDGNDTFFEWVLSRVRISECNRLDRQDGHCFEKLSFNSEHGRAATYICEKLCVLYILQPSPRGKKSLVVHATTTQIHNAQSRSSRLTQRQNIDPGLLLGISLAEACTRELLVVTRRLMDASMPQRSQRCGHLVYENIFHPCNRTSLATWLLRHASLVIEERYENYHARIQR